jgi:hypothetical protein
LKNKVIQIFLLILILIIIFFTYQKYFKVEKTVDKKNILKTETKKQNSNNLIKNLKYNVKFEDNTQYTIISKLSEITYINNQETVFMQQVNATFIDKNNDFLKISSENAIFNNSTYNTSFEKKVKIEYQNNIIQSEKLLLNFEENIVTISDNIIYEGIKGLVKADNIKIDLISKNIEIFMNNSKNKVKIISKN